MCIARFAVLLQEVGLCRPVQITWFNGALFGLHRRNEAVSRIREMKIQEAGEYTKRSPHPGDEVWEHRRRAAKVTEAQGTRGSVPMPRRPLQVADRAIKAGL